MAVQITLALRPSTAWGESLTMSLPKTETSLIDRQRVPTKKSQWDAATLITQSLGATPTTLGDFGVTDDDRQQLKF